MPISAILLYEQVRGDLKRLPRTFFFPLYPTFLHQPRFTKRLGVFIALIYIRNVYTEEEACVCVCVHIRRRPLPATVSIPPCQVSARIIRGERARNTHVLAHSERRIAYAYATFVDRYAPVCLLADAQNSFFLFSLSS